MKHALAALITLQSLAATGQQIGKLRLLVDPGNNFQVRTGDSAAQTLRVLELPEGAHRLRFWAPGYMLMDTMANVLPDRMTDFVARLTMSPEYAAYRRDLLSYGRKRRTARMIPAVATAAATVWTFVALKQHNSAYDELKAHEEEYDRLTHPGRIATLKEVTIPEAKDALASSRTGFILASSTAAACLGATVYMFVRSGKWERPRYDDRQRVLFESVAFVPSEDATFFQLNLAFR